MSSLPKSDRVIKFVYDHALFLLVLVIGFQVWSIVFNAAIHDYLDTSLWRTRYAWLGNGSIDFFGMSVSVQFEGYSDYSFYYVHWGNNMLRGVMPYDPQFGHIVLDGYTNENGAYMFPPFYAYLYAAGIALTPSLYWGIGLLLAAFGFLTVFPVYGIGYELSQNRHVGEITALTYLLNPLTLYYSAYIWLNPAPFVFFFFAGFYMLIKGRKHSGTLLIVCAALFKQTAWFLGLPLVSFLLVRPRERIAKDMSQTPREKPPIMDFLKNYFDLKGFLLSTILVGAFAAAVFLPYLIATPWFLNYLSLAAGGFPLESFVDLPGYGSPIRFQVLPVAAGFPELAELLDSIVFYGFLLLLGVMTFFGIMLLEDRYTGEEIYYLRRLLFYSLLLMLWVHLMGPRGVYKYYFVLFAPFFSIFSSTKMIRSRDEQVSVSASMLFVPLFLSLVIILPDRSVYLFGVLLIFLSYLLVEHIGGFWSIIAAPFGWAAMMLKHRSQSITKRVNESRQNRGPFQIRQIHVEGTTITIRFIGVLDQLFRRKKVLRSQVLMDGEILSEKASDTWNDGDTGLSDLHHEITITDGPKDVHYQILHTSTVFLSVKVIRDGVELAI